MVASPARAGRTDGIHAWWASTRFLPIYLPLVSLLLFRVRGYETIQAWPVQLNNVHRVTALGLFYLFCGYELATRGLPRRWPLALGLYAGFLATGALSLVHASALPYATWKLLELVMALLAALCVLRRSLLDEAFPEQAYRVYVGWLRMMIALALVGTIVDPAQALSPTISQTALEAYGAPLVPIQLNGWPMLVHPNSMGMMCALVLFVDGLRLLNGSVPRSAARVAWVVAVAGAFVLAQSRTAWAAFAIAIPVAVLLSPGVRRRTRIALLFVVACAVLVSSATIVLYLTRGFDVQRLETISGRTDWWQAALDQFGKASFARRAVGLGFVSANRDILAAVGEPETSTLHSDYVDALVSTGWLGATCFVAAVLASLAGAARLIRGRARSVLSLELAGIILMLTVRSFTGTTLAIYNHFTLGFLLAIVLAWTTARRRDPGIPA